MFGFNKRSEEPETCMKEPPVPEIKPCPICGKTPSVYCAGCSMLGSGASTRFWNCRCIDCDYPKRPSGLSVNYCNKADLPTIGMSWRTGLRKHWTHLFPNAPSAISVRRL